MAWAVVDNPPWLHITFPHFGTSNAAHLFVFLSGVAYGIVYNRAFERLSFPRVYLKSARRAGQLYVALLVTFIISMACGLAFKNGFGEGIPSLYTLDYVTREGLDSLIALATVNVESFGYFAILGLYIKLLLFAPLLFLLIRRWPHAGMGLSAALYAAGQLGLGYGPANAYILAWQFVLFVGAFLAVRPFPVKPNLFVVGVLGLFLGMVEIRVWLIERLVNNGLLAADSWLNFPLPLADKQMSEPLVLAYFFALVYIFANLAAILPPGFWQQRFIQPLVITGQHSLEVYCFSVFLCFLAVPVLHLLPAHWSMLALMILLCCALCVLCALLLRWKRQLLDQRTPAPVGESLHAAPGRV